MELKPTLFTKSQFDSFPKFGGQSWGGCPGGARRLWSWTSGGCRAIPKVYLENTLNKYKGKQLRGLNGKLGDSLGVVPKLACRKRINVPEQEPKLVMIYCLAKLQAVGVPKTSLNPTTTTHTVTTGSQPVSLQGVCWEGW